MLLPDRSGAELQRQLAEQRPGLNTLLVSAHPARWLERHGQLSPGTPVLQKPFAREELLHRVRQLLARRPAPVAGPPPSGDPTPREVAPGDDETGPTAFLVGDCDPVREAVRRQLAETGWGVRDIPTGREALRQFLASRCDVALVLIDYSLDDMQGDELARELRHIAPEIAIVYLSAYVDLEPDPPAPLVRKPIDPDELAATVLRLVGGATE